MKFEEYRQYDALGLANLVKTKQVTANELLNTAIARAEAVNPKINAIISPLYDYGQQACKHLDLSGDFAGVPFLLKDLLCAMQGVPMSSGSNVLKHHIPDHDTALVERFKRSGVVIFGKTNTPEFGMMGVTEPDAFGPSRNPWNINHTPGGSSGGSAAAVAAGIVPMASAGDGGGSIRIPAACCGLFGLKPTRGRVSAAPDAGEIWDGAAIEHVVSRSVRDSAVMLDNICGPEPGDPYYVAKPEVPYREVIQQKLGKLTIAYSTRSPLHTPVDQEAINAVEDAVFKLRALGHTVEEAMPDVDGEEVAQCYFNIYFGQISAQVRDIERQYGRKAAHQGIEPSTRLMAALGNSLSAGAYVESKLKWNHFSRAMAQFHQRYDVFLTPCLAETPVEIGSLKPSQLEINAIGVAEKLRLGKLLLKSGVIEELAKKSLCKTPYTQLTNLTGQPGMSVPLYWAKNGLPLGVQFVAAMNREDMLFKLAVQLEEAHPWMSRVPNC